MSTGVLLTAFGGPDSLDSVAPFMCSIMGTEPTEEACADARMKYLTIGGFSPLPAMAEQIASQLERSLNGIELAEIEEGGGLGMFGGSAASLRAEEAVRIPVLVGMLHSEPSIDWAVQQLASVGVRRIIHVSLSPFDAEATTGAYARALEKAVAAYPDIRIVEAAAYHRSNEFVRLYADNLDTAMHDAGIGSGKAIVVFTAHSLPVADLKNDHTYVDQLRETTAAVAALAGLGKPGPFDALGDIEAFGGPGTTIPWLLAFQSKGRRGGEWIGPDLDVVLDAAIDRNHDIVVVCPIGFALDHLETRYDLDVRAAERVLTADREFVRVAAPNADPKMIEALTGAVRKVI